MGKGTGSSKSRVFLKTKDNEKTDGYMFGIEFAFQRAKYCQ